MNSFKFTQNLIGVVLLVLLGGFGGYYLGVQGYETSLKKEGLDIEILNKNSQYPEQVDFAKFWNVWNMVNQRHIKRPLDPNTLLDGSIRGMVEGIEDPYTTYLNTEQNQEAKDSLNGKYEGIGAQIGFDDQERLIIIAPLEGSPAQKAGARSGDKILEIDGLSTIGLSVTEAVNKIRGQAGSIVTLLLARANVEDPFEAKILRDTITLESVTWEDKGEGVAFIRLSRFGETTCDEFSAVAHEIVSQMPNLEAVILDVRNNPGGFLDGAVCVSSEFIKKGVIVSEDFADGRKTDFPVDHTGVLTNKDVRVVVLINEGSASASEIVAGALKEKRDAVIVGKRSFGKGSVQAAEQLDNGSALHVTVAKWLTPGGNWIDKHNSKYADSAYNETLENGDQIIGGIKPDFIVEITEEDIANEYDAQLEKAIEVAKMENVGVTAESLLEKLGL